MQSMTNHLDDRRARWCAPVILLLVCTLAVSVATRYCSPGASSAFALKSLHKHASPQTSRQRLTKDAATWMPPIACSAVLHPPASYSQIAPSGPSIPSLIF